MVRLGLADGAVFEGRCEGPLEPREGETVFTTGSTGYPQGLTDPSYRGQILVFAFPLVGQYGVDEDALESLRPQPEAVVVSRVPETGAGRRFREWLRRAGIPLMEGVDTRALVLHLRDRGTLRGRLGDGSLPRSSRFAPDLVASASCSVPETDPGEGPLAAVLDWGVKESILRRLRERGVRVARLPWNASAREVLALRPRGVLLGNGPGDPQDLLSGPVGTVRELLGRVPLFGICLGMQVLALACGAATEQLPFGHRGVNHPVREEATGRTLLTSQNHGYGVVDASAEGAGLTVTFRHLGDGSVEGIASGAYPAWGVQFHPEAAPGPWDGAFLFDRFVASLDEEGRKGAAA